MTAYEPCGRPGHPARHEVGSDEHARCRSTAGVRAAAPASVLAAPSPSPAPSFEEEASADDVVEENNGFEGEFGSSPDSIELAAEYLGVREGDLEFVRTTISISDYPDRGHLLSFDEEGEADYVRSLADHLRSGGELPPLLLADVPFSKEPHTIVDGNHRVTAYALAGVEEVPVFLARPRS